MNGRALRSRRMRFVTHGVDTTRIDPAIIEIKQRAHGDGIVNRLIAVARFVQNLNIRRPDVDGIAINLLNEPEQCLFLVAQQGRFYVFKDTFHQLMAAQQFRCDRSV